MLGRYTDLIEGDNDRAAEVMSTCFDEVRKPVIQHPDRPFQMVGGEYKDITLTRISAGRGDFSPTQIHPTLRTLLTTFTDSLAYFFRVRTATSNLRDAMAAAPATQQMAPDETEMVNEDTEYLRQALERQQEIYDELKGLRNKRPVFRYQTVIGALEVARRKFLAANRQLTSDRKLSLNGVLRGAKVVGDRFPNAFTRGKGTLSAPESGRKSGSKRSASEVDHDGANDEGKGNSGSRQPTAKKPLLSKPAIAEGTGE